MITKLGRTLTAVAGFFLAAVAAAQPGNGQSPQSMNPKGLEHEAPAARVHFGRLDLELPVSSVVFPAGKGSEVANAYCLMCHSAGMVLRQPPLTLGEWAAEVRKMQSAFGAPIPSDQVDALARYLTEINGRSAGSKPSTVDSQGS